MAFEVAGLSDVWDLVTVTLVTHPAPLNELYHYISGILIEFLIKTLDGLNIYSGLQNTQQLARQRSSSMESCGIRAMAACSDVSHPPPPPPPQVGWTAWWLTATWPTTPCPACSPLPSTRSAWTPSEGVRRAKWSARPSSQVGADESMKPGTYELDMLHMNWVSAQYGGWFVWFWCLFQTFVLHNDGRSVFF